MIDKRFTSEVLEFDRVSLGNTEEYFLSMFQYDDLSVYDIFQQLKKPLMDEPIVKAMSYKNVHKRIRRLSKLKLIKEVDGKFLRGAKKYMLSNKGLFQIMLSSYVVTFALNLTMRRFKYADNVLVATILYQFFEVKTVYEFFTIFRTVLLGDYLGNCCRSIQQKVQKFKLLNDKSRNENLSRQLENLIEEEARKFIFKIIIYSEINNAELIIQNEDSLPLAVIDLNPDKNAKNPNYTSNFPKQALMHDKKFIKVLKKIKNEFDKGCKDYLVSLRETD